MTAQLRLSGTMVSDFSISCDLLERVACSKQKGRNAASPFSQNTPPANRRGRSAFPKGTGSKRARQKRLLSFPGHHELTFPQDSSAVMPIESHCPSVRKRARMDQQSTRKTKERREKGKLLDFTKAFKEAEDRRFLEYLEENPIMFRDCVPPPQNSIHYQEETCKMKWVKGECCFLFQRSGLCR